MALILTSELHRRINNHMNRKGHHSIHVQAVCTQNLFFTSVLAGNVGSVHDARVLWLSPVSHYIKIHRYTFLIILTLLEMLARIAIERTFVERDGEAFLICLSP